MSEREYVKGVFFSAALKLIPNVKWKLRIHTDWILHFSPPSTNSLSLSHSLFLALTLSLSLYTCKKKKSSDHADNNTHHRRHHHNILPIEKKRERERERMNLYVMWVLIKFASDDDRLSTVVKLLETWRVSLKWMCAHANHCEKSQQRKQQQECCERKKKNEWDEMRQKNERVRERQFSFYCIWVEMQCQRWYRQLKVFKVNEFVTNESYFNDKRNTFHSVDFKTKITSLCALRKLLSTWIIAWGKTFFFNSKQHYQTHGTRHSLDELIFYSCNLSWLNAAFHEI